MFLKTFTFLNSKFQLSSGAFALRFDQHKFAAFDLFIVQRAGADADYSEQEITQARQVLTLCLSLNEIS